MPYASRLILNIKYAYNFPNLKKEKMSILQNYEKHSKYISEAKLDAIQNYINTMKKRNIKRQARW